MKFFGRYDHEAVVIDPRRGHAYLTEDAAGPNGLFYRWTPPKGFAYGSGKFRTLADDAGVLQAPRCYDSGGRFVDDLSRATKIGTVFGVDWIDVPDRDAGTVAVRKQFADTEITRARKLEGMWWGDGGAYIVSSYARTESPGAAHDGQVWFYDPKRRTLTLKVLLGVNPDPSVDGALDGPDNITVSLRRHRPRRGRRGRLAPVRRDRHRPYVPDRPQRPQHRHRGGAGVQRVRRRHLLTRRKDPVRQHPDPGNPARDHRPVEAAQAVTTVATRP